MHKRRWLFAALAAFAGQAAAQSTAPASQPTSAAATQPPAAASAAVPATAALPSPVSTTTPAVASSPAAVAPARATAAQTSAGAGAGADDPLFPHLPILKTPVAFWTQVFAEWSENQSAVHAVNDLGKVYTVLDFRADAAVLSPGALAALKSQKEKQAYASLEAALNTLQAMQDRDGRIDVSQLDAGQRRVYEMYADSTDPKRFRAAIGSFRIQRGLRERTQRALETSGRYLPEMERIFASYGLPTKLTRLPLVESSFNVDAYSKAAAAGLWQFIPSSARIYMRLNELVDDRRDPWISTDAAARHLKDDYELLGNWPLALTAYNYGRAGLARALNAVGGTTLTDVIERFQGERFGFASSNFYAEFLAASDVERDYRKYYGELSREPALAFETVSTQHYVPYDTLRKLCGTSDDEFRRLNPAYRPEVVEGRLYVPPGHTIRVPQGAAQRFQLAYASLSPDQRYERQRQFYVTHLVARGESVGKLAKRYGVSSQQILSLNGLASAKKVRAGQTLKIPSRDDAAPTQLASAPEAAPATDSAPRTLHLKTELASAKSLRVRTHRVTSGQTLGAIAKRYQTTIHSLRELNGLGDKDLLRVGSTIKVPG